MPGGEYTIRGGAERAALLDEESAVPFSMPAALLGQHARCRGVVVLGLGWLRGMLQAARAVRGDLGSGCRAGCASGQATRTAPSRPLHLLGLTRDNFLPALFFALSPLLFQKLMHAACWLCSLPSHSRERHPWHASRQTDSPAASAPRSHQKGEPRCPWMLGKRILDRAGFAQQGE